MKHIHLKRSLAAVIGIAAASTACAQSSLALFGIVDAALTLGRGSVANRLQLTNSGYNSSRLGLRGVEDLGGGQSASFWLEAGLSNDDGKAFATNTNNQPSGAAPALAGGQGLTFNRRSTVSIAGRWGELRLGRDHTPQFWSLVLFDPFGINGVGTSQPQIGAGALNGATQVRASNSIGYFLPEQLGGFYGQAMAYFGENAHNGAPNENDGTGSAVRLGYASGPFTAAVATSYTRYAAGGVHQGNIGGQWTFGAGRLLGMYERDAAGPARGRGWVFGGIVPVGSGDLRAALSRYTTDAGAGPDPRATKLALGYVHHFSKRTALYATLARVRNSGGGTLALGGAVTAPNTPSTGADFGMRHSF